MKKVWILLGRIAFWVSWPGLWFYLRWSHRTRVMIVHEDKLLVTKAWLGDGGWSLPGGGLHSGEDVAAGASREVFEETGIEIPGKDLLEVETFSYHRYGLRFRCTLLDARNAQFDDGHIKQQQSEIVNLAWLGRAELATQNIQPDVQKVLVIWSA